MDLDRPSRHERRVIFTFISLLLTIFVIYGNTFRVPFHFDDYQHIASNKKLHLTELTAENITKTFTHYRSETRIYRPVAYFSFALNYFFGYELPKTLSLSHRLMNNDALTVEMETDHFSD